MIDYFTQGCTNKWSSQDSKNNAVARTLVYSASMRYMHQGTEAELVKNNHKGKKRRDICLESNFTRCGIKYISGQIYGYTPVWILQIDKQHSNLINKAVWCFCFPENSFKNQIKLSQSRFILYVEIKDAIIYTITIFKIFKLFFKLGY